MSDTIRPDELETMLKGSNPPKVIDVRRMSDRAKDLSGIPGAEWKDPEKVAEWGTDLGMGEVVVFCVRGGSVSRSVQENLRENISVCGSSKAGSMPGRMQENPSIGHDSSRMLHAVVYLIPSAFFSASFVIFPW